MTSLWQIVEQWPHDRDYFGESGSTAGVLCLISCRRCQVEKWLADIAADLDGSEKAQREHRVGTLGPLYDTGINVAREEIRNLLGVPAKSSP